jgi:hypothetical protein
MALIFPTLIVSLFTLAAVVFAIDGKWNEAVYSISGAILNVAVYFKPFS